MLVTAGALYGMLCRLLIAVALYIAVVGILCRWLIPFIGHMGICTMQGVIRDFAGPYFVSVSRHSANILHS